MFFFVEIKFYSFVMTKHKRNIKKTYTGSMETWTREQVRFLAQSVGIDTEKYRKGHKKHILSYSSGNKRIIITFE